MNPLLPVEHILIFAGAAVALGTYLAWRSAKSAPKKTRTAIATARAAALATMAVIAMNPGFWKKIDRKTESEWAVLIDTSSSMAVRDSNGKTRFEAAVGTARQALDSTRNIAIYSFAGNAPTRIAGKKELGKIKPDGTGTDIASAGMALLDKYANSANSLEGIIILSDGRETNNVNDEMFPLLAKAADAPIYALPFGGKVRSSNLAISVIKPPKLAFAGQKSKFNVEIENANMGNLDIEVVMRDAEGKQIGAEKIQSKDNSTTTVGFTFTPPPGTKGALELAFETSQRQGETRGDDNKTTLTLNVIDDKIKALLIEGRPFWDSKFLAQTLRANKNIEFTGIYRLTPERFFQVSENEKGMKDEGNVIFPESLDKLADYNIVFLGKGVEFFIDEKKADILKRYVRDCGGAVVFARGKPYSGDWKLLASIEPTRWGKSTEGEFTWTPAPAGTKEGIFGDALPRENSPIWRELPPATSVETQLKLKSFAETIIIAKSRNGAVETPALIKSRFGKGVVLAVNSDGLWKWDFFPSNPETADFYRSFWARIAFWAVKHSEFIPNRKLSIRLSADEVLPNQEVAILLGSREISSKIPEIRVMDSKKRLLEKLIPTPLGNGKGWSCALNLKSPGRFKIAAGTGEGEVFDILTVKKPPEEKDNLAADREKLDRFAKQSGGKTIRRMKELEILLDTKKSGTENDSETERIWTSAWDAWYLLIALTAAFSIEWFLRRRNGLL